MHCNIKCCSVYNYSFRLIFGILKVYCKLGVCFVLMINLVEEQKKTHLFIVLNQFY